MPKSSDIESELKTKIEYAKSIHVEAVAQMQSWERLYKSEYSVRKDVADSEPISDTATVYKPAKPRAIVQKFLALLALRAQMKLQVVPKSDNQKEERTCTLLENYLEGFQYRQQSEARRPLYRHGVHWSLLRGKVVYQAVYRANFVDTDQFPIRTIVPDPATVFEVPGDAGLMYVTTERSRYAWELRKEIGTKSKASGSKWRITDKLADADDTAKMVVKEFWDPEYYACMIDDELALAPGEHGYGFCPFAIGYMEDTPFEEREWAGQSVLAPIMDALKGQAALISRLQDASELYFYPLAFWVTPDGRGGFITSDPASTQSIPPDAKITVLNPAPNIPILEKFWTWLQNDINIYSLPEIAWGMDVDAGASGFQVSQVLGQVMDRVEDKKSNLELALGWHFEQVLRLTEKFAGDADGGKFEVMALADARGKLHGKRSLITVGAHEIDEHYRVLVQITPTLPTEKLAMLQQVTQLRQRDPISKRPVMDEQSIRESYPEIFERPDEIQQRIDEEYWSEQLPEIKTWEQEEFIRDWRKTHPPHVQDVEGVDGLTKEELKLRLSLLQKLMKDPQAFAQALQAAGAVQGATAPGAMDAMQAGVGQPGAPGQMLPSSMMPPQMQGGGQMNPGLPVQQMQNAFNPPR